MGFSDPCISDHREEIIIISEYPTTTPAKNGIELLIKMNLTKSKYFSNAMFLWQSSSVELPCRLLE